MCPHSTTLCWRCRFLPAPLWDKQSQGAGRLRWVDAHFILGMTYREIAQAEGVDKSSVRESVLGGLRSMKKYLQKNS